MITLLAVLLTALVTFLLTAGLMLWLWDLDISRYPRACQEACRLANAESRVSAVIGVAKEQMQAASERRK